VVRPHASFGGQKKFPGPFAKAAALMESLIQRYPLVDGNKRTGTASAVYLLRRHGYRLIGVTNKDLVDLTLSVAAQEQVSRSLECGSRSTPRLFDRSCGLWRVHPGIHTMCNLTKPLPVCNSSRTCERVSEEF
jgi:Fic/DOC family